MIKGEVYAETLLEFLAPVRKFLEDRSVSEIMINGPKTIYVERRGRLELTDATFGSTDDVMAALRNAAQFVGKYVDEEHPILEGRLPDGSRIEAVIPPAAPGGPIVSIRRFSRGLFSAQRLVDLGTLTHEVAAALAAFVVGKCNVLVSGGTGSGKTSLLNMMTTHVPESERIIVIEDSQEVQVQRPHAVYLEARPADARGKGAVTIRDLFRASLRMRPDRLVLGEIRGGEALDVVQAMVSGHGGCLSTLHASHPHDALTRLETMCMMSDVDMPLPAMRAQIASGIQVVVQVERVQDGTRKVTHVSEVAGWDPARNQYDVRDLFVRTYGGLAADGSVRSELAATGVLPRFLPQLLAHGVDLPEGVRRAAEIGR
jgi:pilus assembly protein CpaF